MESGEAYKGACWCEKLMLSAATIRRLSDELPEDRCLCSNCLGVLGANPNFTLSELIAHRGAERL